MMKPILETSLIGPAPSTIRDIYPVLCVVPGYIYYSPKVCRWLYNNTSGRALDASLYQTLNLVIDLWWRLKLAKKPKIALMEDIGL